MYQDGQNPNNPDDNADYGSLFRDGWTLLDWQTWYYANKDKYGQPTAQSKFVKAWEDHSFFSSFEFGAYSWAKYDQNFHDFIVQEQIPISNFIADIKVGTQETVGNVGTAIQNVSEATKTTTGTLKYLLPAVAVGLGVIFLVYVSKKVKK